MKQKPHWTEESNDAFAHRIAFDFIAQVERRMEAIPISQADLARKLGVTEGAVSHVLNNPQNLTLKTVVKYSRALGLKAGILAYDDDDPQNGNGPVNSELFVECWERLGKPVDRFALAALPMQHAATDNAVRLTGFTVSCISPFLPATSMGNTLFRSGESNLAIGQPYYIHPQNPQSRSKS